MFIGYLRVNIFIPHCRSLKEKRRVILRVKDRAKNKFNISLAGKPSDKWQLSELAFVCVNYTRQRVNDILFKVEESINLSHDIHILDTEKQTF